MVFWEKKCKRDSINDLRTAKMNEKSCQQGNEPKRKKFYRPSVREKRKQVQRGWVLTKDEGWKINVEIGISKSWIRKRKVVTNVKIPTKNNLKMRKWSDEQSTTKILLNGERDSNLFQLFASLEEASQNLMVMRRLYWKMFGK